MNAFDLQHTILAPHAQHPVIVHFPIALFMISYLFDLLAVWRRNFPLVIGARYNLTVAALATPAALMTGLIAWQWKQEGASLQGNLRLHLIGAILSSGLIWSLWWRRRRRQSWRPPNVVRRGPL